MSFQVHLGQAKLELTRDRVLFFPRRRSPSHLTVYFVPNPDGRYAGFFSPHVTRRGRGNRRTLGIIRPEVVSRFFQNVLEDMREQWISAVRPASLRQLKREGWFAAIPPDEEFESAIERRRVDGGVFRVDDAAVQDILDVMLSHRVELDALDDRHKKRLIAILREAKDGRLDAAHLCWLPASPNGEASGAGWYMLPCNWLDVEKFGASLARHVRPGFVRALRMLGRLLHLELDEERLALIEAQLAGRGR